MSNYYPQRYFTIAKGKGAEVRYEKYKDRCERLWLKNVNDNYLLDIRCDLNFKQRKEIVIDGRLHSHKLDDSFANQNISEFLHRLNQKVYGNAYKRFDKKLDVIISLEGGKDNVREDADTSKLTHAHISVQQPNHIPEKLFILLINECWIKSEWGFSQINVERIKSVRGTSKYQIKNSFDSIIPAGTYCKNHLRP